MLEQSKKIDETQRYMEQLEELVIAGRANLSTYTEISKSEISIKEKILNFVKSAPKYSGNPEKVFKRWENLETHLWKKDAVVLHGIG